MRLQHVFARAAVVAVTLGAADGTGAAGTIIIGGAIIQAGSGTPQGVVTIDPAAPPADPPPRPPLGTLTTQGTITGALPAKPGTGAGGLGDVTISTNSALPGGTLEYTNFTIDSGAVVSFSGPVTILATESVEIGGSIESFSSGETVTIIAGDSISIVDYDGLPVNGIRVLGPGGGTGIRLEADRVDIGVQTGGPSGTPPGGHTVDVITADSDIVIRSHGTAPGLNSVEIDDARVQAGADGIGALTIQSAEDIELRMTDASTSGGDFLCQAFGGTVLFDESTTTSQLGNTLVEADGTITIQETSESLADRGDSRVESFGGDVVLDRFSNILADDGMAVVLPSGTGEVTVAANGSVSVLDGSEIRSEGTGGIRVTAHTGDVLLGEPFSPASTAIQCTRDGGVLVESAGNVETYGSSGIEAQTVPLVIRAHGGLAHFADRTILSCVDSGVDVRATDRITLTPITGGPLPAVSGSPRSITGETVLLVAGAGGIDIVGSGIIAESGFVTLHAVGDIEVEATVRSNGGQGATFLTEEGSIYVIESLVVGGAGTADESGDVLLESFGGDTATIDVTDSELKSADVTGESGDVSLIIHAAGAIESFVLPKTVKVQINEGNPGKSRLIAAGFFDTGPDAVDLTGPATITVGGIEFEADLQPKGKQKFLFRSETVWFQIKVAGSGSSKSKFRLQMKRDLQGQVSANGELTIRFATASADGQGTVKVQKGKYKLGSARGLLVEPNVFPFKLKQVHNGPGKDSFEVLAGIATEGGTPAAAPEVTVGLADGFEFVVPGDQFTKKGDKYIAKNPAAAPDVDLIQIDYKREQLRVKAKNLTLGEIGGARPATIQVGLGDDSRAVSVRISPKTKKILKY